MDMTYVNSTNLTIAKNTTTAHSTADINHGNNTLILLTAIFVAATLAFNVLILLALLKSSSLRTPFSVYVINLAITDILLALVPMPANIIKLVYGYWPYDWLGCTLTSYIGQMASSGNRGAHVLITANRLWAVTFPVSYKTRHTKRLAQAMVLLTWALGHCLIVPVVVGARKLSETGNIFDPDPRCAYNNTAQVKLQLFVQLVGFTFPEIFVVLAYPCVMCRLRLRWRPVGLISRKHKIPKDPSRLSQRRMSYPAGTTSVESPAEVATNGRPYSDNRQSVETSAGSGRSCWNLTSHNKLFAYLVLVTIVCWTPNHVFYLMSQITGYWNTTFFYIQLLGLYANSWLNPILIYLADAHLRRAVNGLFRWH